MTFTIDHALILIGFVGSLIGAGLVSARMTAARDATTALKLDTLGKTDEAQGGKIDKLNDRVLTLENGQHSDRTRAQAMETRHAAEMTRLSATMEKMNDTLSAMRVDIASIKSTVRGDTGEIDAGTGSHRRGG